MRVTDFAMDFLAKGTDFATDSVADFFNFFVLCFP